MKNVVWMYFINLDVRSKTKMGRPRECPQVACMYDERGREKRSVFGPHKMKISGIFLPPPVAHRREFMYVIKQD